MLVVHKVPGFDAPEETEAQNEPKKKSKKASGGFQAMAFSFPVLKGITKRGYKQPTPIQRKSIPIALEGKDLVAMARTGSGKTACFVLPIIEKLSTNKPPTGKNFRALILSPTRELALQTLRFVRELGKFTGLKSAAILGGDSIDNQFSVLTGSMPDIVVATPGRFLHVCVEMNLQLNNISMIVFDEADRLFELGFGEQLREIVARLPSGRQSLLFSATLPKMLVEFARAGLTDPVLLRLDVEWKLPSALWLGWIAIRSELRTAALLQLLNVVLTPTTTQAVVFAATKHHVEYLHLVLQKAGIGSTFAYSGLDPSARKIALGRFTAKKCAVLLVTDVAARGLDLPSLDTVINYNFPAKPKLFVHRVGRCARAGRSGRAFSLVAAEDVAHLLDLHLFLGASVKTPAAGVAVGEACPTGVWGSAPAGPLEAQHAEVAAWERDNSEISEAARLCGRGWQQYIKWREAASAESNKRAKSMVVPTATHPYFLNISDVDTQQTVQTFLDDMKKYTPKGNILELTAKNDSPMYLAMKAKRSKHGDTIKKTRENKEKQLSDEIEYETSRVPKRKLSSLAIQPTNKKKKIKEVARDENYISHHASDERTEMGMAVNFNVAANTVELDLGPDSSETARGGRNAMRWDRKRKKMVHAAADGGKKMIRTESGGKIPASFRSGRYAEWQKRNVRGDNSDDEGNQNFRNKPNSEFRPHWMKHNERIAKKATAGGREMRDKQQIVKERLRKEKLKARLKHKGKGKGNKGKGKRKK